MKMLTPLHFKCLSQIINLINALEHKCTSVGGLHYEAVVRTGNLEIEYIGYFIMRQSFEGKVNLKYTLEYFLDDRMIK